MIESTVQPFGKDATLQAWLGAPVRAAILADAAKEILAQTDEENSAALGDAVAHRTLVDGSVTEAIERVRAEGTIVRSYDLLPAVLIQIGEWLWQHSPVRSGRYQRSHQLLADGSPVVEVTDGWSLPALSPDIQEFTFVSLVSYAPLIEPHDGGPGESRQAPDGVYQVIAALAQDAFGALASISFAYLDSEPAITVRRL